jgi:SAM-dependent methyltransferase
MNDNDSATDHNEGQSPWNGIGFSGVTLVLGAAGGRLVELLAEQVARSDGLLLVADYRVGRLRALSAVGPAVQPLRVSYRQLPLLDRSVDLLVSNGVLRETPEAHYERLFEEFWRVLADGGQLRISDILEPAEVGSDDAWRERNRLVRKLSDLLDRPAALSVNLTAAARALRNVGYDDLGVNLLAGYPLTDDWLEETVNAAHSMAARLVDRAQRAEIIEHDVPRLIAAYAAGGQRAPERFVLSGRKVGSVALDLDAPAES